MYKMEFLKKLLHNILTGRDNETFDLGRISWIINNFSLIGFTIFNGYKNGSINIVDFANAAAVIVGAHGLALWVKQGTEPDKKA